ncbi:hypothetical protein GQ600_21286 [Phytophthora cactorum]|nr:hypothetical protein GQ600_21286 [Phytophthora cactorum]
MLYMPGSWRGSCSTIVWIFPRGRGLWSRVPTCMYTRRQIHAGYLSVIRQCAYQRCSQILHRILVDRERSGTRSLAHLASQAALGRIGDDTAHQKDDGTLPLAVAYCKIYRGEVARQTICTPDATQFPTPLHKQLAAKPATLIKLQWLPLNVRQPPRDHRSARLRNRQPSDRGTKSRSSSTPCQDAKKRPGKSEDAGNKKDRPEERIPSRRSS